MSVVATAERSNDVSGEPPTAPHVVVCGAGVVGACTAYFLAQKGAKVTVVERCEVACAASGKAGGFLAKDWCRGPVGALAEASYALHEQLASEINEDYGYRKVTTLSLKVEEVELPVVAGQVARGEDVRRKTSGRARSLPEWIDGPGVGRHSVIGTPQSTAQVHPRLFTKAILNAAVSRHGVKVEIGEVQDVLLTQRESNVGQKVAGIVVDGRRISADAVVLAMGPWSSRSPLLSRLFHISGLKANSVVIKPLHPQEVSAEMLFTNFRTYEGRAMEPEVYPRPSGEVYICGMSEEVEVPDDPSSIAPSAGAPAMLRRVGAAISENLANGEVVAEQACFLPCSQDGVPVIGPVPEAEGVYVATGHSCWGILNAPATGASLSDLILHGKSKLVDLRPFYPQRFCVPSQKQWQ